MDTFDTRESWTHAGRTFEIVRLRRLEEAGWPISRLPYSIRILLENVLRREDGLVVTRSDIEALAGWKASGPAEAEIDFMPARVLLQDFTGVPALVDLAAMRDAMAGLGGDPRRINPLLPVELVVDHSIQVDAFGEPGALASNEALDYGRNRERYAFLKWGQRAFDGLEVVPPNSGIVHQVNLERLARVVFTSDDGRAPGPTPPQAYPDTLLGTDSHTPMVNGIGVLGWGVGGIEAEAALLGQPVSMLVPRVVGFRLTGRLREGMLATDLVLTITEMLRRKGVVGSFVEFFGPGLDGLTVEDRGTIANMSPEYGATCAYFPVDALTLDYLRVTGRSPERLALVEAYLKEQGLFRTAEAPEPECSDLLELDLGRVESSIAGPGRPQDRIPLSGAKAAFAAALPYLLPPGREAEAAAAASAGAPDVLDHGSVVIAAITSCTNTSNPSVMLAAGLLARKAAERGLQRKPWVKTSLAPGSRVVLEYYQECGLLPYLERLGFYLVGYGCTTCIGNSGPLPVAVSEEIEREGLVVCAVLSGNRNFEGRINPEVRANYLMSPPLVVAYALAGRMDLDLTREPLGTGSDGTPAFLRELWPSPAEVQQALRAVRPEMFERSYRGIFEGSQAWRDLAVPGGDRFAWEPASTYIRLPSFFEGMPAQPPQRAEDIRGARVLALLGDSITTDHISPAGSIQPGSPAGQYLIAHGTPPDQFNSYGARRGNHEVMVRGTFANPRLRNALAAGREGGYTTLLPGGQVLTIYEAALAYADRGTPLLVIAGKEYGSGSSRDWAAKGPRLLGVRAVLAESYERIHRSNLIGMGLLPLQFLPGESAVSLGLHGTEAFDVEGIEEALGGAGPGRQVRVLARDGQGGTRELRARVRIDTPAEALYYRHGGILPFVLRGLRQGAAPAAVGPAVRANPDPAGASPAPVEQASVESFPASDPPSH